MTSSLSQLARATVLVAAVVLGTTSTTAAAEPWELVVVLADTGRTCQSGLPVLTRHPQAERHLPVLTTGMSGRLVRAYRLEQQWLAARDGRAIEPAYLLLSSNQGGFARTGFCLDDEPKPQAGFVDLPASQRLSGAFGAVDQIFPHEQLHVILHQLAGEVPTGGANQVHAIGVRTDPHVAFNEGFAEHIQVMAVDDPEAQPDTAALRSDVAPRARADRQLDAYRRTLVARWAPAARPRLGFVLWFGSAEQVLRYHGVKDNRFAFAPAIPERLLEPGDPYGAYLLDNVMPGDAGQPRKSQGRLRATEGVVSAFFLRLVNAAPAQQRREDAAFYRAFGTRAAAVPPVENAYLKVFTVMAEARTYDVVAFARAYRARFPAEAATVQRVADEIGLDLEHDAPEVWMLNNAFTTGTTLFDQYRGIPRAHTFDLNAASLVDLLGVPGMTQAAANAILAGGPYLAPSDLEGVAGVPTGLAAEFTRMSSDMTTMMSRGAGDEDTLSFLAIFMPAIWRALAWLAVCATLSAAAYRAVRRQGLWRLALAGLGVALLGLSAAWVLETAWWMPAAIPLVVFALPAATWQLARKRPREATLVFAAWTAAILPVLILSRPLG